MRVDHGVGRCSQLLRTPLELDVKNEIVAMLLQECRQYQPSSTNELHYSRHREWLDTRHATRDTRPDDERIRSGRATSGWPLWWRASRRSWKMGKSVYQVCTTKQLAQNKKVQPPLITESCTLLKWWRRRESNQSPFGIRHCTSLASALRYSAFRGFTNGHPCRRIAPRLQFCA